MRTHRIAKRRNSQSSPNCAFGYQALFAATGSYNVGIGNYAGFNLTSGSNNIDIGNEGVAGENGIIRIGTAGTQITTVIAGIENAIVLWERSSPSINRFITRSRYSEERCWTLPKSSAFSHALGRWRPHDYLSSTGRSISACSRQTFA
jgi:hypothetical protein